MEHSAEHSAFILSALRLHLPGLDDGQSLLVAYTWLAMLIIVIAVIFASANLKRIPGIFQNAVELIVDFLEKFIVDIIGPKGLRYFPLVITVFLFILVSNYLGLVPGCEPPTVNLNTTAAWAIIVFIYYQYLGFSKHGLGYLKHFMGPIPVLAPFMFVMELISEFARPLSLSVRLFANIMAGEIIITQILFPLFPVVVPVTWMFWESIITAPIQAFVFSLMTMIYIAGAVAADTHEEHA